MTREEQLNEYATMAQMETEQLDKYLMKKWFTDKTAEEFWSSADFTNGRMEEHNQILDSILATKILLQKLVVSKNRYGI